MEKGDAKIAKNEDAEGTGCAYNFSDPRGRFTRFIALFFMCFLGFGSYFCYDNPGALQDYFTDKDLSISTTQYSLLYSMYSWPNVVLCFIGGFLIDRVFGIRNGANIYMGLTLAGQVIFATGVITNLFWVMVLGRFVFGIGAESLQVAQNSYAALWFRGRELNMVFGLQLSIAKIGSTVNFQVMEPIAQAVHKSYSGAEALGIVLFIATTTCIFSMLCSILLGFMDIKAEKVLNRQPVSKEEVVRLTDVKDFPLTFWLLSAVCVFYYTAVMPFIGFAKEFFITRFDMGNQEANTISSLIYLISGIGSPFLGLLIDKVGKNAFWIVISVAFTIVSHILLVSTSLTPYVAMVLMGLSYSALASSLWPLVTLMISETQLGTAYGVCQAIQNLGLGLFTLLVGVIVDQAGYFWVEIFFIGTLSVAFLASITMWLVDSKKTGILNMTPGQREKLKEIDICLVEKKTSES